MSFACPALPSGTPALANSFGSIGALLPADTGSFVQIGVSMTPGWTVLTDRVAIISSWMAILTSPDAPRIACYDERVMLYGDAALVLCEEELGGGTLAASNLFVCEDGGWRIAHHHAGQIVRRQAERRPPSRLN